MTRISAQVSAILNNAILKLISLDEAVSAMLRLIESESGASLAAHRKMIDKVCKCGRAFKGLEPKEFCNTCLNTAKKRRQRSKNTKS